MSRPPNSSFGRVRLGRAERWMTICPDCCGVRVRCVVKGYRELEMWWCERCKGRGRL